MEGKEDEIGGIRGGEEKGGKKRGRVIAHSADVRQTGERVEGYEEMDLKYETAGGRVRVVRQEVQRPSKEKGEIRKGEVGIIKD